MAELCNVDTHDFLGREQGLLSPEEQHRLRQQALAAWRRGLRPLLVAAIAGQGAQPHQIRAQDQRIEQMLGGTTDAEALRSAVADLIRGKPCAEQILEVLPAGDLPEHPDVTDIEALEALIGAELVDRVRRALTRETRQRVDDLRRRVVRVAESTFRPLAPPGLQRPPGGARPQGASGRPVKKIKVGKNQRRIDWVGAEAERWVLSAALEPLLANRGSLPAQVEVLAKFLRQVFPKGGDGLDAIIRHGEAAALAEDDDELVDRLASFLHLSATSDDFGCDVLSLVDPSGGCKLHPLLLEVKSVGGARDRSFYFSRREHDVAKDVGGGYAVAAVVRPESGDEPTGIELLVDPVGLQELGSVAFVTDTWQGSYRAVENALDP